MDHKELIFTIKTPGLDHVRVSVPEGAAVSFLDVRDASGNRALIGADVRALSELIQAAAQAIATIEHNQTVRQIETSRRLAKAEAK